MVYYNAVKTGSELIPEDATTGPYDQILKQQRKAMLNFIDFKTNRQEYDTNLSLQMKRLSKKHLQNPSNAQVQSMLEELNYALTEGNTSEAKVALKKAREIK